MRNLFTFICGTIFGVTLAGFGVSVAGNIVLFEDYKAIKDENIKLKEELEAEKNKSKEEC